MPQPAAFDAVFALETRLGATWPNIRSARDQTAALHKAFGNAISGLELTDASIVVFGSLGRFEATTASDIDWTYLIDGQANLEHQRIAQIMGPRIEQIAGKGPGPEGVFGALAFSHNLLQYIGGEGDTNTNLTRRVLLLLESKPLGDRVAYDRVIRVVLKRYLTGDHGWKSSTTPFGVPRFLHNDIARYWRTVAVDFAYKRWARNNKGWALRSAKLRMSRKLTYAAGLIYAFSLAESFWRVEVSKGGDERIFDAVERLWQLTQRTPLDLLAEAFSLSSDLDHAARRSFDAYDRFLGILGTKEDREHLDNLKEEAAHADPTYDLVRELGKNFQAGLSELFLKNSATPYPRLTEEYGVF